ncbi:MAG: hypothetical protein ACU0GG_00770 [Paracoccaceae bacterium]
MTGPSDGTRMLLTVLLALWALAYGYSLFEIPGLAELRGEDGTGVKIGAALHFLGWQAIAGLLALAVYGVSRLWPQFAAIRQIGMLPVALAFLLLMAIAAVILAEDLG